MKYIAFVAVLIVVVAWIVLANDHGYAKVMETIIRR